MVFCKSLWTSFTLTFLNPTKNVFIICCILTSLGHHMPKTCALINPKNI
jgi:hypothetical protein